MSQYNKRIADLENDMNLANETISKLYTDADMVCALDDGTYSCGFGKCGGCKNAEQKCKCIAATYFQYGYVHNPYHKKINYDAYRMSFISMDDTKTFYRDGICNITYRNASDCIAMGNCLYENDENRISFKLDDKSEIEMTHCELGAGKNPDDLKPRDDGAGGKYTHHDRLKIDGSEVVRFNKCIANSSDLKLLGGFGVPHRGDGACYWCSVQLLYEDSNGGNSNVKDTNIKDMDYKKAVFYTEKDIQ